MIYPRLKVAKDLLADDGVIFISIDDNEQENLKKIVTKFLADKILLLSLYGNELVLQKMMLVLSLTVMIM